MSNNKNSLPLCQTRGNHNNKTPNRAPNKSLLLAEIILPAESPAAVSDCAVKLETTLFVSHLNLWRKLQRNRSAKAVELLEEHRGKLGRSEGRSQIKMFDKEILKNEFTFLIKQPPVEVIFQLHVTHQKDI